MAVTILKKPAYLTLTPDNDAPIISAYNRTVIEWSADGGTVLAGEIKITDFTNSRSYEFKKLVPNPDTGSCKFDLSEVFRAIMQQSNTAKITVKVTMNYADATSEFDGFNLRIIRSVAQFGTSVAMEAWDYGTGVDQNFFLALLPDLSSRPVDPGIPHQSITVWEGFPFEVHFINEGPYSRLNDGGTPTSPALVSDGFITKDTLSTGLALNFTSTASKKGYFYYAVNTDDPDSNGILLLDYKVKSACGAYVRWVNHRGGYSYWLFQQWYQITNKIKSLGIVQQNYDDIKDLLNDQANVGQEVLRSIKVYDSSITEDDYAKLVTMAAAKDVWLYGGAKGSGDDKWIPVRIVSMTQNEKDTTKRLFKAAFELELPKLFTQTI